LFFCVPNSFQLTTPKQKPPFFQFPLSKVKSFCSFCWRGIVSIEFFCNSSLSRVHSFLSFFFSFKRVTGSKKKKERTPTRGRKNRERQEETEKPEKPKSLVQSKVFLSILVPFSRKKPDSTSTYRKPAAILQPSNRSKSRRKQRKQKRHPPRTAKVSALYNPLTNKKKPKTPKTLLLFSLDVTKQLTNSLQAKKLKTNN